MAPWNQAMYMNIDVLFLRIIHVAKYDLCSLWKSNKSWKIVLCHFFFVRHLPNTEYSYPTIEIKYQGEGVMMDGWFYFNYLYLSMVNSDLYHWSLRTSFTGSNNSCSNVIHMNLCLWLYHRVQAQVVHMIKNRICDDQQQNILLKCAYFVVMINNRMLTQPTTECYKNRHSVVGRVTVNILLLIVTIK